MGAPPQVGDRASEAQRRTAEPATPATQRHEGTAERKAGCSGEAATRGSKATPEADPESVLREGVPEAAGGANNAAI